MGGRFVPAPPSVPTSLSVETMTCPTSSCIRTPTELCSAVLASCAVLALSVATQLAFDQVLSSKVLPLSATARTGGYGSHVIFTSAICALILSLFINRPTLRALALVAIWWCAVIGGTLVEIATTSHPVYYLGIALRALTFLGIGVLLTRIALCSCAANQSPISNSHPIFPSADSRQNCTVLDTADESCLSMGSPYDTDSDGESSALLEKSLLAREQVARDWCSPVIVNFSEELDDANDNIVYVDFEDDIARVIMRSGGPLRHRFNQKHLPQVEVHVTVQVTKTYS